MIFRNPAGRAVLAGFAVAAALGMAVRWWFGV